MTRGTGRNCPNCGAVYEPEKNKCSYCGTSYFDMTAINIPAREPFYLKVKVEVGCIQPARIHVPRG